MTQHRQIEPTRSYPSQVHLPVAFGLASTNQIEQLQIEWTDGTVQTLSKERSHLKDDTILVIEQYSRDCPIGAPSGRRVGHESSCDGISFCHHVTAVERLKGQADLTQQTCFVANI